VTALPLSFRVDEGGVRRDDAMCSEEGLLASIDNEPPWGLYWPSFSWEGKHLNL
jgi:hypothetical protein